MQGISIGIANGALSAAIVEAADVSGLFFIQRESK
jgi:hypothetical protein